MTAHTILPLVNAHSLFKSALAVPSSGKLAPTAQDHLLCDVTGWLPLLLYDRETYSHWGISFYSQHLKGEPHKARITLEDN